MPLQTRTSEYGEALSHASENLSCSSEDSLETGDAERGDDDEATRKTLATRETAVVAKLRLLLVFILLSILGISVTGMLFLKNSSRKQFEHEFAAQGYKVVDAF